MAQMHPYRPHQTASSTVYRFLGEMERWLFSIYFILFILERWLYWHYLDIFSISPNRWFSRLDGYFLRTNTTDCPAEGLNSPTLRVKKTEFACGYLIT